MNKPDPVLYQGRLTNFIPTGDQPLSRPGFKYLGEIKEFRNADAPAVTMAEFGIALTKLPKRWGKLKRDEVALCEYRGCLLLCNQNKPPIIWRGKKWEKIKI